LNYSVPILNIVNIDVEIITDQLINIEENILNNTILIKISDKTNTSCINTELLQNNDKITTKDVETDFRSLNLYTERILTNQILIEPNTSTVDANLILEDRFPSFDGISIKYTNK
jgi:hypothetical protein